MKPTIEIALRFRYKREGMMQLTLAGMCCQNKTRVLIETLWDGGTKTLTIFCKLTNIPSIQIFLLEINCSSFLIAQVKNNKYLITYKC